MKKSKDKKDFVEHFINLVRERSAIIDEGNWLLKTYKPQMDALKQKYGKIRRQV